MKTIKNIAYTILVVVAISVSLESKAQCNGQEIPAMSFQTTSTMTGSGSAYAANPSLDAAGFAVYGVSDIEGRAKSAIRKSPTPGSPYTPGAGDQTNQFPIGDGTWILAFFALSYAIWRGVRGRIIAKKMT